MYQNNFAQQLGLDGTRQKGADVRGENVAAINTVVNIVKSSLGPQGLDKMIVDDLGDVTITNDGATILQQLELEHPAARLLVELANTQDRSVGDGTTSVTILTGELLKVGNDLIKNNIHPTNIISGFRLACGRAITFVEESLSIDTAKLGREALVNIARTSMSSKILGSYSDFFANMVVEAVSRVKLVDAHGVEKYPVEAVNILKQHGRGLKESTLIHGYALPCTRSSQQMPKSVSQARIALLDFDLRKSKLKMGISVEVTDVSKLEAIRERENTLIRDRIQMILDAGANVIMTTMGIDDLCSKYLVANNIFGVRRVDKKDMRRIAKVTGGKIVSSLVDLEGEEVFDANDLGHAEEVAEETLAGDELIYVKGGKTERSVSIVLRGANEFMLDEMDRTLHDAICVVRRVLESKSVVAGGGAVEAALSVYLERFANTIESREQLAISQFAQALTVIPKTLASNAACDATELVARLRAYHNESQTKNEKKYDNYGLDLMKGEIVDNFERGVLEPALTKIKYLEFATEAAITILRIDDHFVLSAKSEEQ